MSTQPNKEAVKEVETNDVHGVKPRVWEEALRRVTERDAAEAKARKIREEERARKKKEEEDEEKWNKQWKEACYKLAKKKRLEKERQEEEAQKEAMRKYRQELKNRLFLEKVNKEAQLVMDEEAEEGERKEKEKELQSQWGDIQQIARARERREEEAQDGSGRGSRRGRTPNLATLSRLCCHLVVDHDDGVILNQVFLDCMDMFVLDL